MIKKYLIIGHMWWCSLVVGKGTREAEIMGSNPGNARKNVCIFAQKITRWEKIYFWFLFTLQIFILARKRMMTVIYVLK